MRRCAGDAARKRAAGRDQQRQEVERELYAACSQCAAEGRGRRNDVARIVHLQPGADRRSPGDRDRRRRAELGHVAGTEQRMIEGRARDAVDPEVIDEGTVISGHVGAGWAGITEIARIQIGGAPLVSVVQVGARVGAAIELELAYDLLRVVSAQVTKAASAGAPGEVAEIGGGDVV